MKKERQFKQGVLVLLFLLFSVGVKAQYWIPLNYQPDKKPLVTHSDGLHYYACYEDGFTKFGKIIRISKWDGLVWQRATPLVLDSNASINAMCVFKGELYLGGDFYLPNITAIQHSEYSAGF